MKIMIVDDEPLILTGIENIIVNEFGKSVEIVKAFDGIDAFDKLKFFSPDLIITDICMPEMSGLELIDKVIKSGKCSRFIILTGYADFEYARQAIQYNALDYILKPIDKAELVKHINLIHECIEQEKDKVNKYELNKIREIILYDAPYEEMFLDRNIIDMNFPYKHFTVVLIQTSDITGGQDFNDIEIALSHFFNKYYIFLQQHKKQIIILVNFEQQFSERVLYNELSGIRTNSYYVKSIGISKSGDRIDLIHTLYNDALRHLHFNKFHFDKDVFEQNDIKRALLVVQYSNAAEILESNCKEDMDRLLKEYLEKLISINDRNADYLNSVYSMVISDISIYLRDLGLSYDTVLGIKNNPESRAVDIADAMQFGDQVKEIFMEISKFLWKKDLGERYTESVSKMLDYINANFMKDISLDDVAETANLHPNYASSLFKKEIGTSFIQYLNSYRILKAKAFIKKNAELSLDKIAEMVGYENSCHFIKVFKKYCSMTPGEYRSRLKK